MLKSPRQAQVFLHQIEIRDCPIYVNGKQNEPLSSPTNLYHILRNTPKTTTPPPPCFTIDLVYLIMKRALIGRLTNEISYHLNSFKSTSHSHGR